ncbi:MAG: family 43 glycosylhydrolase [Lachnospiraceae bacterium]|nr:family 43 glycosylhydrolase [Butyrivibrio sp.]MCM1343140.1 family 43 glycosylhydrolase [Muribaculaceae bacterium]MCM1411548.1 family 43 glycosylhydrolase [Lachnospiraceae bacterium]
MKDLFKMIRTQNLDALKGFLVEYPRGLDVETEDGVWALHEVMAHGGLEMARYVTEYAIVNMNLIDRQGNTVLHYGVKSGDLELVRYLVERVDSPIGQANLHGVTPFDLAVSMGLKEIQVYFEEKLGASAEELYHNPICRGLHPDPSIVRVGADYYMVNSSFMFFPCIPISHSRDLIHWTVIGHAINNPEWARLKGLEGGRGYWAPDISYNEGRFYITATYRLNEGGMPQRLQMVTSSEKPEGPYCEPVFLDEDGIDPSIFTDLDGRRYMLLNRGARIFEISRDGKEILSEPKLLWYGQNKKASEGPHLLYKDGYYYLFMAEGGTGMGHRITVARSRELMGVYESCPYNPILRQWDDKRLIQCSGHGMPVETQDGDWYMVYLCNRISTSGYAILGRETSLDPITWTADGWPLVNALQGPSELQKKPKLACRADNDANAVEVSCAKTEEAADVVGAAMGIWGEWMTVRGTEEGRYEKQGEEILIHGNGLDLNDLEYNTILVRPQQEFCFGFGGKVSVGDIQDVEKDWDAGLTCYYDENSYLKLALAYRSGQYGILSAEYVDDRYVTEGFIPLEKETVEAEFKIVTEQLKRTLYYKRDGEWTQTAVFEDTSYLSSEGLKKGKRFTGATAGIYVNGCVTARFSKITL